MNLLEKYQSGIQQLYIRYNVNQLHAFGSVLTDEFKESSDIDLIVSFNKIKIDDYASNYYNLKSSLEDVFKRPVDLPEENTLKNPYFKKSMEKQWQLIYG